MGESSKMVPTFTEYCFLQSRHFHMRRVERNAAFLLEQRGHTASPLGHFTAATSSIHVSGLLQCLMALIKPLCLLMLSVSIIRVCAWRSGESSNLLPKVISGGGTSCRRR